MCQEMVAQDEEIIVAENGNANDDYITLEGLKEQILTLIDSSMVKNVAIFIDYDNIYYTMKDYGIDITDDEYNICKMLNDVYGMNVIRKFRAYADFDQVGVKLTPLQEQRVQVRHVYGNGKGEQYRKNASDIELSIDAIETYYKNPDVDTYVFVTSDSDMIPIMSRLKYKNKQVHLYYLGNNTSHTQTITNYADISGDLLQIFNVDVSRTEPSYWVDMVKNIIQEWHNDEYNSNKYLGGAFLVRKCIDKCKISQQTASKTIEYMTANNIIETREENGGQSYYIK